MKRTEIFDLRPSTNMGDSKRVTCLVQPLIHYLETHTKFNLEKAIKEFGKANAKYIADLQKEDLKVIERQKRAAKKLSAAKFKARREYEATHPISPRSRRRFEGVKDDE